MQIFRGEARSLIKRFPILQELAYHSYSSPLCKGLILSLSESDFKSLKRVRGIHSPAPKARSPPAWTGCKTRECFFVEDKIQRIWCPSFSQLGGGNGKRQNVIRFHPTLPFRDHHIHIIAVFTVRANDNSRGRQRNKVDVRLPMHGSMTFSAIKVFTTVSASAGNCHACGLPNGRLIDRIWLTCNKLLFGDMEFVGVRTTCTH